jgi:DNA polymerase
LFGDIAPAPVKLTPSTETFEQIHAEIGDCTRCPLHLERTHVVHTEGNRKARLMFVAKHPVQMKTCRHVRLSGAPDSC